MSAATTDEPANPSLIQGSWSFQVTVEPGEDPGVFIAVCVEHPELAATGPTDDEAVDALADLLVEMLVERGELAGGDAGS